MNIYKNLYGNHVNRSTIRSLLSLNEQEISRILAANARWCMNNCFSSQLRSGSFFYIPPHIWTEIQEQSLKVATSTKIKKEKEYGLR